MQTQNPTIFILFGASGDLVAKKIIPALFYLFSEGKLPRKFQVIGFARTAMNDQEFRARVTASITKAFPNADAADLFPAFLELFSYHAGQYDQPESYESLARKIHAIEKEWGLCMSLMYYLAVPPKVFSSIFNQLKANHLTDRCSPEEGWSRVIVEKPFGMDLKSAEELDEELGHIFREAQIYRVDHYLAKEMLQNIMTFRFANNLFEQRWNRDGIERIDIRLLETLGVESRGSFYDRVGAFRDVGQNHLLQMLSLVIMDQPASYKADDIRTKRAQALAESLRPLDEPEVARQTYRAQYDGYQEIQDVSPNSQTETYFKIQAVLAGERWAGVPVTIESGKRTGRYQTEIEVTFKHPAPCLCQPGRHFKNRITFQLTRGEEGIAIEFWTKKQGLTTDQEQRSIEFSLYEAGEERIQYVTEYAKLLLDAINGDQTLYVSTAEIREMWRFSDPIVQGWDAGVVPLHRYQPDSDDVLAAATTAIASARNAPAPQTMGIVGLGKMGSGLASQLLEKGWRVHGWNRSPEPRDALAAHGMTPAESVTELVRSLDAPRTVWLMVPAGRIVDELLFGEQGLSTLLEPGDTLIDGGNSFYKDSIRRAAQLKQQGINFLDAGVSGGPNGARHGACIMVGGDRETFAAHEQLFRDLSVQQGYAFFEGAGAGHFVKMVHNGIEYGMMQAIAEGFMVLKVSPFSLDLSAVSRLYNHGSVIESRLIEWLERAYEEYGAGLDVASGSVAHTGEAQWTVDVAKELGVKAQIIDGALQFRVQSAEHPSYTGKVLTALRNQFGGHSLK